MRKGKKRSVLLALCMLLAWLSFVVDGAHALFVDTVALTGNVITTGTTDLLISNSQNPTSTVFEESRPGFAVTLIPGVPVDKYFLVKNVSPAGFDMDLDAYVVTPGSIDGFGDQISVKVVPVDSTGTETGGGITRSLAQLRATHSAVFGQALNGESKRFKISIMLASSFVAQGDSVTYDFIVTGTQHLGS